MTEKYRYNDDGSVDIKRKITTKIGPFQTFYEIGDAYFPCMTEEGDTFFTIALSTGPLGGHKFYTGNYLQGLLYFATFGLLGVGYILDLMLIITGNYNYMSSSLSKDGGIKVKTYSKSVEDKKKAWICTLIAAIGSVFVINGVYWPLIETICKALSMIEVSLY